MKTANQEAIGRRLEGMYHVATAINDVAVQLISNSARDGSAPMLCVIEELAKGQARELEALAEYFHGSGLGYYASQFKDDDAVLIVANQKPEEAA